MRNYGYYIQMKIKYKNKYHTSHPIYIKIPELVENLQTHPQYQLKVAVIHVQLLLYEIRFV